MGDLSPEEKSRLLGRTMREQARLAAEVPNMDIQPWSYKIAHGIVVHVTSEDILLAGRLIREGWYQTSRKYRGLEALPEDLTLEELRQLENASGNIYRTDIDRSRLRSCTLSHGSFAAFRALGGDSGQERGYRRFAVARGWSYGT